MDAAEYDRQIENYESQIDKLKSTIRDLEIALDHNCPYCDGRGFVVGWENSMPNCRECGGLGYIEYVPKKDYDKVMKLLKLELKKFYDREREIPMSFDDYLIYYCKEHHVNL
jgi:RecJ-like exonuclease